ncbi:MAG: YchJ family protein [Pseudomonadales bacterium]|nr:YchJ family protein [Pseudomonadales bacterium]
MSTNELCPCGSQKHYADCCEPFHTLAAKPDTAQQLMRSRYCAFVKKLTPYLLNTRHPSKRHLDSASSLQQTFASTQWLGLQILTTEQGLKKDSEGFVSFAASFSESNSNANQQQPQVLEERSRFLKEGDQWYYVEEDFNLGRNDICWCGSGKKFKKCHGR